ncbi:hypothetical protein TKV_c18300 [Thermoanaerobacter kivui]|uniref:PD-(D/E)XK endonuclease-like domain-containing protein n=1 Tax=Thermoanaerobacter kivui TaxID=2325 RepID=A0A097AT16_THEKI|nr:hypothetical protein [Thermoanaerobacter kivui]AIS52980.1 hypothetical protein TKV_c18300 [Thermoanaerobacter kivui]
MKDKYISATEINQFAYCPYQWYYIKKYGIEYINSLRSHESLDFQFSNFKKGMEYHEKYYKDIVKLKYRKYVIIFALIAILIIIAIMRVLK